jgi:hypothetical protein
VLKLAEPGLVEDVRAGRVSIKAAYGRLDKGKALEVGPVGQPVS